MVHVCIEYGFYSQTSTDRRRGKKRSSKLYALLWIHTVYKTVSICNFKHSLDLATADQKKLVSHFFIDCLLNGYCL